MICARHDWWDAENPCPRCGASLPCVETVTVAVTPPSEIVAAKEAAAGASGETVEVHECLGPLDIPYFLRRTKDGGFKHPELLCRTAITSALSADIGTPTRTSDVIIPAVLTDVTLDQLNEWVESSRLTCDQRQPILRELWRREDRIKARLRIEKMKAAKAAKDAAPCSDLTKERSRPASLC